jgi:hypothetical protein
MKDEANAWRLWHLMQLVSDALWDYNEEAFLKFCEESQKDSEYICKSNYPEAKGNDVPF